MSMNVYLGRKFNANHQLAILLVRHLGLEDARYEARKNGWRHILAALDEQDAIVTVPR
ncbi:hypothetical protein [Magnetovibrio blakemorei]|uniref:hypothetical protein n=1 Tax=Magnetovibrio blakemorei TaxID=28181 RepID=UPI00147EB730|nr:hypothetical protein [Magnetovibrio blakemorei]